MVGCEGSEGDFHLCYSLAAAKMNHQLQAWCCRSDGYSISGLGGRKLPLLWTDLATLVPKLTCYPCMNTSHSDLNALALTRTEISEGRYR